jgi:steroid delta-isomerase-like uncharacterized protein
MSSEVCQQLVRNLIDAWNAHDVDRVVALYAPDYEETDVAVAEPQRGPDAIRRTMRRYLLAFPDLHIAADEAVIQPPCIALAWTLSGHHGGILLNIPATGRLVQVRGVSLMTIDDTGLILRLQRIWDLAGLLRAIGLLPEL